MSSQVGDIRSTSSAKQIRRARAMRLLRQFVLWVGIPTMLSIVYYGCLATPQYESTAVFTVQSNKGSSGGFAGLSALLPGVASSPRDAMLVREFALSRTMLDHLVANHDLAAHYQSEDADFWSKLSSDASTEDIYEFYLKHVNIKYLPDAGTMSLKVLAFSADKAQSLNVAVMEASEQMINDMSTRARRDRLDFIAEQVKTSETRLANARKALVAMQVEGSELSPMESATAILGVRSQLESALAGAQAELSTLLSVMTNNAPEVRAKRHKVQSLQSQVNAQNKRLVDNSGDSINNSIAKFEPLFFEKEVAEKAFQAALASHEIARMEVLREQRYLVRISEPSLPQNPTEPRRLWGIATVFFVSLVLMSVLGMLGAAVREHAKF